MIRRISCLVFLLLTTTPVFSSNFDTEDQDINQPVTTPTINSLMVEGFSPDHLSGTWAIGTNGSDLLVRHWLDERLGLDLIVGGNYEPGSAPQTMTITTYSWGYEFGVGLRQNIARPIKYVFVQWLIQLDYSQTYSRETDTTVNPTSIGTNQGQTLNLYFGPGFEAFLPFWNNLSVEASVGVNILSNWSQSSEINNEFEAAPNSSSTHNWSWNAGVGNNNTTFSIINAAVHCYL